LHYLPLRFEIIAGYASRQIVCISGLWVLCVYKNYRGVMLIQIWKQLYGL